MGGGGSEEAEASKENSGGETGERSRAFVAPDLQFKLRNASWPGSLS